MVKMAFTNCTHEWKSSLDGAKCKLCDKLRGDGANHNGFVPRNDNVLVRLINLGVTGKGIAMPDAAEQGKELIVLAVGPLVSEEFLKIGDKCLVIGEGTHNLANCADLFITQEKNIPIILGSIYDE